ncbi:carbohydrate ABC transporter permease [Gracilibacillus oryzae]|uniref:Carbohydrate ABC transporter permease n=1 Tax=Gracilibacillus oryzae TaxID=1672701 RepID=A0A7C8KM46_9BACI|nr:carbohydrate ABC transporter permease [Gracilibacillus oryzae]KAB8125676.1 carbohydrate ABC transporter permease [Gracilibacillus oryzae]
MYHKTLGYKIFSIFNYTLLISLAILCILPLIHVLAVSFSGKEAASANIINLLPIDFTTEAYEKTFGNPLFLQTLYNSFYRTALGTFITMAVLVFAGYALSKEFKGRNFYMWFIVFTMLFSGGMIPNYILVSNLNLTNTVWALVLPGVVNAFNLILLMNFFKTIPKSLEEAAKIDGAGFFRILFQIYLPLSMAGIATITLFTMVGHWNSWFDGLIYMRETSNYPLATFLQTIVVQQDMSKISTNPEDLENLSQRTVKSAQIFIGALPILLVYPFLQKYFVKGIVMGSVKE